MDNTAPHAAPLLGVVKDGDAEYLLVTGGLNQLLPNDTSMIPNEATLIGACWVDGLAKPSTTQIHRVVQLLLQRGQLRRVVIGSVPHLARVPKVALFHEHDWERSEATSPIDPPLAQAASAEVDHQGADEHRKQLLADLAHEKATLWRVVIALEIVSALIIAREIALLWVNTLRF